MYTLAESDHHTTVYCNLRTRQTLNELMVNGLHLYSSCLPLGHSKGLHVCLSFTHSHTHRLTLTYGCQTAMCWPAHQEQHGVQCLAQGHVDIRPAGIGNQTTNLAINRRPSLPPEPLLRVIPLCGMTVQMCHFRIELPALSHCSIVCCFVQKQSTNWTMISWDRQHDFHYVDTAVKLRVKFDCMTSSFQTTKVLMRTNVP